jgi:hemolysin activation/secretion protein
MQAQYASEPLLPHDQLAVGGTAGVRGYEELSGLADNGAWGSLELGGPVLRLGAGRARMGMQPVVFLDAGWAENTVKSESETLASAGAGLRWQVGKTLSFSADHAWQLEASDARFHLAATLRF